MIPTAKVLQFVPDALAASRVGVWDYDVINDKLICDETMEDLFGLSAQESSLGSPISRVELGVHAEDRAGWLAKHGDLTKRGGIFVREYRTLSTSRGVRWVLARGSYDVSPEHRVLRGRGVVIDITEQKQVGYADGQAFLGPRSPGPVALQGDPLERAAELSILLRECIAELGGGSPILPIVDILLMRVGQEIASGRNMKQLPSIKSDNDNDGVIR